ncbi:MAG: hypothetical protein PHX52_02555 [Candidatus Pacebacteria bacterium]|nr:hypothetical protein [Candidatus Paceibacterota bacterium]
MNNFIKNSLLCIIIYLFFIFVFSLSFCNLEKSVNLVAIIVQSMAIIIGGFWAYDKFGWDKKCENIITLKAALMEYRQKHNWAAMEYRKDSNIANYKLSLMNSYNQLSKKIHLSYYVPKELRAKIFNTIWLTIGNDTGKDFEKIDENWINFEKQLKEIYDEFDKIIS